jgi:hypothetical protein
MYSGKEYMTKVKPNDDNGCNAGDGSEPLGLMFFVVRKLTL